MAEKTHWMDYNEWLFIQKHYRKPITPVKSDYYEIINKPNMISGLIKPKSHIKL